MDGDTITSTPAAGTMTPAECFRTRARECRVEAVRCRNRGDNLWASHWSGRASAFDEVALSLDVEAKAASMPVGT